MNGEKKRQVLVWMFVLTNLLYFIAFFASFYVIVDQSNNILHIYREKKEFA